MTAPRQITASNRFDLRHCPRHQGNFERPRHPHHLDVVVLDPVLRQPFNAGIKQLARHELVEFRDDNPKPAIPSHRETLYEVSYLFYVLTVAKCENH